ncbi:hypothetical protein [Haloferula rosea]|uniref:Uncharacterized protein n=1 Tax=Haloferula rosea TaxID=490093 RepID=A0A934RDX2_9BACT|nr:hypothetical protein [Haloferula rosea]MBK1826791.1 hypothetical protein [Haloferula rosea]
MNPEEPKFPHELAFMIGKSHIAGKALHWLKPGDVPQPFQKLLVHDQDMTSKLAAFHSDEIRLEVLKSEQHDLVHLREVVLHAATHGTPVEYGVIEILLDAFPPDVHQDILEGQTPLGTLIIQSALPFRSEPQGFFSIAQDAVADIFPKSPGGENLYGRYNHLMRNDDGSCLARIIEILPLAP